MSQECNSPVLCCLRQALSRGGLLLQFAPTKQPSEAAEAETNPLYGLISVFRFDTDGTVHELPVDRPIDGAQGWLWLHFNLADARACNFLRSAPELAAAARELLLAPDGHQQLHADGTCVYGVFADLVCRLGGATDEIGFLHFTMTEKLYDS